jgi:hypothetical protein
VRLLTQAARDIGHVVRYKERLREFCHQQKARGVREIVLIGESDLAFILEWCAEKEGLGFRVVRVGEGTGEVERERSAGSGLSEGGLSPHRFGGEKSPPTQSTTVYVLSELYPELSFREGGVFDGEIPLHEIVLGKR